MAPRRDVSTPAPFQAPTARGRTLWGALFGALVGGVTYWVGAALVAADALLAAPRSSLPGEFARPAFTYTAWELVLVLVGAALGALVARYRWRVAGLLSFVGLLAIVGGYLSYSLTVSIPEVPAGDRWLSFVLLAAETCGLGLVLVHSFYSLDAATRRRWARLSGDAPRDPALRPMVAFEVPVYNEPPEMVAETVTRLLAQDYPRERFLVVVADDSTDAGARERTAAFCRQVGAIHSTRTGRRGFKAGALNAATARLPKEVELVAVVDADFWVEPGYLAAVVGYFTDPALSFVQTPQDYRNGDESFLTRRYERAEAYFYRSIMPSRNEENAIIFCGTMGILRRAALADVGGFAEDQICEDAEISVRLAMRGWRSLYVNRSFGRGLMPATFDAYKKQFHRWAFGNVRILFTHGARILASRMRARQKFDFLVTNLHWFDGLFVTAVALVLLYLGAAPLFGHDAATHHQRELALLALVPLFLLVDGVVRLHLALGRAARISAWQTVLVQGMWFAIKFTNMRAALKCMLGFRVPFVRTPKSPGGRLTRRRALGQALGVARSESLMGIALAATAALQVVPPSLSGVAASGAALRGGPAYLLLPAWLGLYALFFLCAPIYAYLSYRTLRPLPGGPARPSRSASGAVGYAGVSVAGGAQRPFVGDRGPFIRAAGAGAAAASRRSPPGRPGPAPSPRSPALRSAL